MATIHDVAERAGLSVKTVSRYLSGYTGVSPKTIARIEKASEELEFFPSAAARSLRGGSSGIVCLIADNLTTTPFSYEIVKGVQSVCEVQGKLLLIGETRESEHIFDQLLRRFRQQRVEAVIKATFFHKQIEIAQKFEQCPLVLVNCFEPEGKYYAVVPDDEQGAYDLTRRLISMGHRDIAYLCLPEGMVATTLRRRGFERAMREAGLAIPAGSIAVAEWPDPADNFARLRPLLEQLRSARRPPTGLMCGNDKMALRVMMILRSMGLEIPGDVSVVGFDDYRPISENTFPLLTTAALPYHEMGVRAARKAFEMAQSGAMAAGTERCRCDVVARDSDTFLSPAATIRRAVS